ncbi:MAG: hypothetical protein AVDCRST_MAG30-2406 [uncultured Solirubrobacteraceae bacterium]|uniref:Uncharacterized protein n=1 Tax=uncultured Solirubrobacteraceae bacterium TaxID=1162706 RepID=A0A6J4SZM2_9ACTN|nr:MAG: hypothetical protein AVDCRST_MAG30-2406 [uncultured Solirubrobacteraceae bacterium]
MTTHPLRAVPDPAPERLGDAGGIPVADVALPA